MRAPSVFKGASPPLSSFWALVSFYEVDGPVGVVSFLSHLFIILISLSKIPLSISKVLSNRFQKVAHGLILDSQNVFVKGRQISDSILIAFKCIDSRLKTGIPGVLCKLDVEKAYDHVNWCFLMYMLQRCGFSVKWRKWIMCCISIVKFSILINRSPLDFFRNTRGVK